MPKETIRVVICGDTGVGKSSLIASLVKGKYIPNVQDKLPPISIPKDYSSSPYSPKNTILIDTSNEDVTTLHKELKTADVIWLLYCDHDSYERVSLYWMMMFRSLGLNLPVVLAKTKCDNYDDSTVNLLSEDTKVEDQEFIPILMEFKEVDVCIKVSSRTQFNINQAFYLCQRSISHPVAPLFDSRVGELKPLAILALKRIFLLSDEDQDGYLSDPEILALQKKCFKKSIDVNELANIRELLEDVSYSEIDGSSGAYYEPGKGMTVDGFLLLNKIYAERGRHETTWGILRAFHYTDSLSIKAKVLYPKLNVSDSASVELSPKGYRFFVNLFLKFDKDNDGGLSEEELRALFKCTPGLPHLWSATNFPYATVVNERGCITLQGWLAQWSMTTFLDYKITTAYLVYFGFQEDAQLALQITKSRKMRRRNGRFYRSPVTDRKVFNCFIFGKPNSGKSSLLESFLGRPFSEAYSPTIRPRIAVNNLELKGGRQYYLILQEFGSQEFVTLENRDKLKECDVLCFAYDSSDPESFSYIVELFNKHRERIEGLPLIFVALKADLDKQQQRCQVQPDDFSESLLIDHPLHVSSTWLSSLNELFVKITEVALVPGDSTVGLPLESKFENEDYKQTVIMLCSTAGFVALLSYTFVKVFRSKYN
ncbi:hypothetical protein Kpol_1049p6 [Vanderwaltozyma polyspora DSM 70294]|uniref:Mitochondrial Rho GTPase n=1 Tax=Vanderwaltozyma polyspora (strain ATCC 22028 / DSM 70294 / BCRC 21397 / CBS 2163 / NBRC 10782 / NRRL Y-8283 / UCD 57-17) TaxID=436907 RepID=A7TPP7_VANPO|nr:uncharacterized protein Kpol_1049p6 [Vanderwaltozyma polyspora DSM 70294]EDO15749.1 hypothetical protein Kpol_1049p6 [Vanderwaltozyma polyspora DSM 70294]